MQQQQQQEGFVSMSTHEAQHHTHTHTRVLVSSGSCLRICTLNLIKISVLDPLLLIGKGYSATEGPTRSRATQVFMAYLCTSFPSSASVT